MLVLPVLDILDGVVVRGIAGRRNDYRPITSRLTQSHEPLAVASAIRCEFGLTQFYIADLDGIMNHQPNQSLYLRLIADGFRLLIDPGIRDAAEATRSANRLWQTSSSASKRVAHRVICYGLRKTSERDIQPDPYLPSTNHAKPCFRESDRV